MKLLADGVLIIDKKPGMTSNDTLKSLKTLYHGAKMGHGGTLDPFATGVLPILLNRATRLAKFFLHGDKVYEGDIFFGWSTDTYDRDGRPLNSNTPPSHNHAQLQKWIEDFQGTILQKPPIYSSLKWKGKPLYYYARKGLPCPRPDRKVHIYHFEILEWKTPHLLFRIQCSGGTYIRSIAHDLGQKAGCGAHLAELRRLRSGLFTLSSAVRIDELRQHPEGITQHLIAPESLFPDFTCIVCSGDLEKRVRNGNDICVTVSPQPEIDSSVRLMSTSGILLGIGRTIALTTDGIQIHPSIVLV